MAHIKLEDWHSAMSDSLRALDLDGESMKAHYYLGQSQLALNRPHEAHRSAVKAYERCIILQDRSIKSASDLVLRAKKERWRARERQAQRDRSRVLKECETLMDQEQERELRGLDESDTKMSTLERMRSVQQIETDWTSKKEHLHQAFSAFAEKTIQRPDIPDYLIDSITFCVMHDPVVTKTGNSYDRVTLLDHLHRSQTDPLTREPLKVADLRPNLALRQACEEFLEANGWAVDY